METQEELKVFIVDDDPVFCTAMEHFLQQGFPGARVSAYSNGEACLHEIDKRPDVVLLDYKLDTEFEYAWDGLQILKKIHGVDPGITVILLSAQDDATTAMKCINEGALDYIVKDKDAFTKVKDILMNVKDELIVEEDVEIDARQNTPQIIGLVLLILFVIILLSRL